MTNPFVPKHDTLQCDYGCCRAGKYALGHTASSPAAANDANAINVLNVFFLSIFPSFQISTVNKFCKTVLLMQ